MHLPLTPAFTAKIPTPCRNRAANGFQGEVKVARRKAWIMKKERRWLKSAIAASTGAQAALPWERSVRRRLGPTKAAMSARAPQRAIAAR
jgi:hypothetical protein